MKKSIKLLTLSAAVVLLNIFLLGMFSVAWSANAATIESKYDVNMQIEGSVAEPYALFVDVVLSIDGANGEVWSIAQTRIAIFASGIQVVLDYSSDTYQESYTNMTLEKRVSTSNLKKGEIIKAVMPTNGVQKYWKGRMYYRADSAEWKFAVTSTLLFDSNGILVL